MLDKTIKRKKGEVSTSMGQLIALIGVAVVGIALTTVVTWRRMRERGQWSARHAEAIRLPGVLRDLETAPPPTPRSLPRVTTLLSDDDLDWIALAADELRTPLTVLRGYAEYLRQHIDFASRTSLAAVSERLIHQVERLEGLIEAWSVTAQMSGEQRIPTARPCDLLALVRTLCARLTTLDDPPCAVAEGAPVWALVDQALVEHALAVIIRSARRAAPDGLIEVVVRATGSGATLRLSLAVGDRRAQARGQVPDMWEGLEIDLARVLCEEQGGWVELADRAGGGAITTLWLPGRLYIPIASPRPAPQIPLRKSA